MGEGRSNIDKWRASLTPEQRKELHESNMAKARATRLRKQRELEEAHRKAKELLPIQIANNLLAAEDANWNPDQGTINAVREMIEKGLTTDEIKTKIGASDRAWQQISKFIFKSFEPNREDIGLQILQAKKDAVKSAQKKVELIEKEIRLVKRNERLRFRNSKTEWERKLQPQIPNYLLTQLSNAMDAKLEAENEYARLIKSFGFFDSKNNAPSITIKTTVPRPGAEHEVKEITQTKKVESLEDAMKELKGDGS